MKVLVVYKSSMLLSKINKNFDNNLIINSLKEHKSSIQYCFEILNKLNISYSKIKISSKKKISISKNYHLIISLGGDGTFLSVAQSIREHYKSQIVLGINSSPCMSIGYYCAYSLIELKHRTYFKESLKEVLLNQKKYQYYHRLCLVLNNKLSKYLILNDALITEKDSYKTSLYSVQFKEKKELHKSSGLWISTYTGSHGGYKVAGGKPLLDYKSSKKLQYAFFIRELCNSYCTLTNEYVNDEDKFIITSGMENGYIYLDGGIIQIPFKKGNTISFKYSLKPLFYFS